MPSTLEKVIEGRDEALARRVEERERKRKEREADRIRTRFGGQAKNNFATHSCSVTTHCEVGSLE